MTTYTPDPSQIATAVLVHAVTGRTVYACTHANWSAHFPAWQRAMRQWRQQGEHGPSPAEPMPYGHCMFESPASYGYIRYGSTERTETRQAITSYVHGSLHGWERDLDAATRDRIVTATVNAYLHGENPGASPFLACIYATR